MPLTAASSAISWIRRPGWAQITALPGGIVRAGNVARAVKTLFSRRTARLPSGAAKGAPGPLAADRPCWAVQEFTIAAFGPHHRAR